MIVDCLPEISQRKTSLEILEKQIELKLSISNQNAVFNVCQRRREEISRKIIGDPWSYISETQNWLALSYLIEKCYSAFLNQEHSSETIDELATISKEITILKNEIAKLEKNQAKIIEIDGKKEFCLTEDFPLSFVPKTVENEIKATLGIDDTTFDQWTGDVKNEHAETIITQTLAMEPASRMVRSEKINRQLKLSSNNRIFQLLNGKTNAKKFVQMSSALLDDLLISAWKTLADKSIVEVTKSEIYKLGRFGKTFSKGDIDWYLDLMKKFITHNSNEDTLYLPFFTIQMLQLSVFKWSGLPQVGKELNYVGKTVEDLIFNLAQSYNAETAHPITKKPLLRAIDPATKEEIADIIIYNSKHIVIIESKFWDCPHLQGLEDQLAIFKKKVESFTSKRRQLGFPEAEVIPVFYTPFPPYSNWQGIQLIPSQFLVGWLLGRFFEPKKPDLAEQNEKLRNIVLSEDYPIPYPIDAHELDASIPINLMRINDGRVIKYAEHEIELKIMNPIGDPVVIILDINKKTFEELRKLNVSSGDLIRFGAINHSGSWTITQFLHFAKIDENDPKRKIKEILGNSGIADEVIGVFQKHKLDIFRFVEFCKTRTPTLGLLQEVVAARLGSVLNISDSYDFVTQCECGNVVGLHTSIVEQRKAISGGKVLCYSCLKKNLE